MRKNILIIGGSSGVGLDLAKRYSTKGHAVRITGRRNPNLAGVTYRDLPMTSDPVQLARNIDRALNGFDNVHTLVYAAGFLQRGHIDTLSDSDLGDMVNVGILAPMMLVQRLKRRSGSPLKIILITSSSQYTPRELEPAYCATKSALGMLGASLARDKAIGKVLVAAPSGMRTPFWADTDEDTSTMLDPHWVSQQIVELSGGRFKYKFAKLLRDPARVEIVEVLSMEKENKPAPRQVE